MWLHKIEQNRPTVYFVQQFEKVIIIVKIIRLLSRYSAIADRIQYFKRHIIEGSQ